MPERAYTGGYCQLNIDGVDCGVLRSMEGGAAVADVVVEPAGALPFLKKHLGRIRYTPLTLQFGLTIHRSVFAWIAASWGNKPRPHLVTITTADYSMTAVSKQEFFNALITEVTLPAMDGGSKEPGYVTMTIVPEYTRTSKASGRLSSPVEPKGQKVWIPSNFRLAIAGLDCTRVTTIDAITVTQSVVGDNTGERRDYAREVSRPEFPHVGVTISAASAQTWVDWFDDFAIKGNCDDSREKQGTITFLGPDLKEELSRVDLFNLGIFALAHDRASATADRIATLTARLYCERMELRVGEPTVKPARVAVTPARRRTSARARKATRASSR